MTIEGPNGVGKTSVVLVSGFQIENETAKLGSDSLVLLPDPFQFTQEDSALDFKRKVYSQIASYFISNEGRLRTRLDLQFGLSPLKGWLENPLFHQGSVTIGGFGGGGGSTPNGSSGFDFHGFFNLVDRLLTAAFSPKGGVICVLDNLEILNTSQAARQRLESLRDDLFSKHGLKWVVCGARGIVRSVASSPRLQGRLQEPFDISPLASSSMNDLIHSRVKEFRAGDEAVPPVGAASFRHVFSVLNDNLRDSLKFAQDFALWLNETGQTNQNEDEYQSLFEIWLADQSEKYAASISVPPRSWKLFDDICDRGGYISPSDFSDFGFNSAQNMRGQVAKLEQADLVVSELDETDHRRKTIAVVAKGWLMRHHRAGYAERTKIGDEG